MDAPLLAARDLRVDAHGIAEVDGLTFETTGSRVLVVGAAPALFEAASGVARPVRGSITLRGEACVAALARGALAGASLDPPVPQGFGVLEYATWSARLAGVAKGEAAARAARALELLGVSGEVARGALATATLAARRAAVLAGAIATGAEAVVFEDPTASLDDPAAHVVGGFVVSALAAAGVRAWVAFAPRAPLDSPLVQAADEALVLAGSRAVAQGKPGVLAWGPRRYAVDARGPGDELLARLESAGAKVSQAVTVPGWTRFVLELPDGATTRDLFAAAEEVGTVVVELRPLREAFT